MITMPPEVAQLLKRCGVDPKEVIELEITCSQFERPNVSLKLAPAIEKIDLEIKP